MKIVFRVKVVALELRIRTGNGLEEDGYRQKARLAFNKLLCRHGLAARYPSKVRNYRLNFFDLMLREPLSDVAYLIHVSQRRRTDARA